MSHVGHAQVQPTAQQRVDVDRANTAVPRDVTGLQGALVLHVLGEDDVQLVGDLHRVATLPTQVLQCDNQFQLT